MAIIAMRFPKQKYIIRNKLRIAFAAYAWMKSCANFPMQRNRKLTHLLHIVPWREQRAKQ